MQPWALVSPASRGIGFEVARRLLATTTLPIVATTRKDPGHTKEAILEGIRDVDPARLSVYKVDVLEESTVEDAASACNRLFPKKDAYLHMSFVLPGLLFPEKSPQQINYDDALLTFRTNTLGPMLFLKHFSAFLPRKSTIIAQSSTLPDSAVWATMSARVGSITDNHLGGWYSYRASKAAVNQITKTFDNHLRTAAADKAIAIALHPGTVKTGLSKDFWANVKDEKLFSPDFAAQRLVDVVRTMALEQRGKCWDWQGKEIPP